MMSEHQYTFGIFRFPCKISQIGCKPVCLAHKLVHDHLATSEIRVMSDDFRAIKLHAHTHMRAHITNTFKDCVYKHTHAHTDLHLTHACTRSYVARRT